MSVAAAIFVGVLAALFIAIVWGASKLGTFVRLFLPCCYC